MRRYGLVFGVLVLLIFVEVMTVFAVLASQRYSTERALRQYSQETLKSVIDETRENAAGYLRQAQDSVLLTTGVLEAGLISTDDTAQMERYLLEHLRIVPQIDALYYGDADGNFVFSKRAPANGPFSFFSKIVRTGLAPAERVTLIERTNNLVEGARRNDPADTFDPRRRPWYERAIASNREIWTDPYIFYTSQQPGLTVAHAVRGADGMLLGVVGADIELSAVSDFLRHQAVDGSGAAFIVHSNGDVLAHPDESGVARRDADGKVRLKKLADLDRVSAMAGIRFSSHYPDLASLQSAHYDRFRIDERSYLSMFVPLLTRGDDSWVMGVYAPEDELATRIRDGQRESLFLGVAVSLLVVTAAVLVGLMAWRPSRQRR